MFFLKNKQASWDNIYIEYDENVNREMGVDVPDSFVAQTKVKNFIFWINQQQSFSRFFFAWKKTPPKYPPPSLGVEREDQARSSGSSFSQLSISNGHSNRRSFPGKFKKYIIFFREILQLFFKSNYFCTIDSRILGSTFKRSFEDRKRWSVD